MKVLQISVPFLPVTPKLGYGGIERIVYLLDKELNKKKISLGVVAPEGSKPESRLFPTITNPIGVSGILDNLEERNPEEIYLRLEHIAKAIDYSNNTNADIIHIHDDNMFVFGDLIKPPSILTLHTFYELFWDTSLHSFVKDAKIKLVAISDSQKKIYESHGYKINFVVHHGIDEEKFSISDKKYPYLLSLGCIHPLKGQEDAIKVGKKTGLDVIIAGNIGNTKYFKEKVAPFIDVDLSDFSDKFGAYSGFSSSSKKKVFFTGVVNDEQKKPLYSNALAFLMPIKLEEPFGLVMIEALMSGTPVIAYNRGSVPEIVTNKTGFIVKNLEEMTDAVKRIEIINPVECRKYSVEKFSSKKMAENYTKIYEKIIDK